MHICTVIKDTVQFCKLNETSMSSNLNDDSDGAHLTSFGIEFQTEEEAKENERSPSVALLCAGLLRRGMVYELERVLQVCNGFLCSMSVTYDGAVLLWQWCCYMISMLLNAFVYTQDSSTLSQFFSY